MEKAAQANRELLAFLATQPQSKPCKFHSDCIRLIDEEATKEATRYFYFIDGKFHAGYAPCPKCVQDAANNGWKKFGVPEILIHATFENYTPDSEVEASHVELVKAFCAKRTGFLPLLGGYGTGKAHLAVAALRSFGGGWIVKQASLLCALRDTYSDKTAFDPIERAQSARLLVLGDVGLSAGGRDELPMLHEILDYRHGERLPTIITRNPSDLNAHSPPGCWCSVTLACPLAGGMNCRCSMKSSTTGTANGCRPSSPATCRLKNSRRF